ncbi:hypothetical protein Tco_0494410 [Tanacetum coccineum]
MSTKIPPSMYILLTLYEAIIVVMTTGSDDRIKVSHGMLRDGACYASSTMLLMLSGWADSKKSMGSHTQHSYPKATPEAPSLSLTCRRKENSRGAYKAQIGLRNINRMQKITEIKGQEYLYLIPRSKAKSKKHHRIEFRFLGDNDLQAESDQKDMMRHAMDDNGIPQKRIHKRHRKRAITAEGRAKNDTNLSPIRSKISNGPLNARDLSFP